MRINIDKREKRVKNIRFISYATAALILSVLQVALLDLIEIGGITPDLLVILVVWIAIREGQFNGLFFGFGIGLLLDIISFDLIGTNALSKTIAAFVSGFFYKEGKSDFIISNFRLLGIVFLASAAHNLVYFFMYIKLSDLDFWSFFLRYGIATSLYTTVVSILAMIFNIRRRRYNI
ncbi:MAG: rod shape-determining protein MreD [Candidatus Kapaibacterium sp.]